MDFKKMPLKTVLAVALFAVMFIALLLWKASSKADVTDETNTETSVKPVAQTLPDQMAVAETSIDSKQEDSAIEEQLERDRQEQRETKYLKTKLEQTDLELQEQKALTEINKLKMENMDGFSDESPDGQKSLPDIKIEYIGGDEDKKEAILSIGGKTFQVREKSSPTDNVQVLSISDSSITLHFSAPIQATKTIYFKPE